MREATLLLLLLLNLFDLFWSQLLRSDEAETLTERLWQKLWLSKEGRLLLCKRRLLWEGRLLSKHGLPLIKFRLLVKFRFLLNRWRRFCTELRRFLVNLWPPTTGLSLAYSRPFLAKP